MAPLGSTLALLLAAILLMAAVHKLAARDRLAAAAARLTGLPDHLGSTVSLTAAAVETLVAFALVVPATRGIAATSAAMLWLAYAVLLFLRRGERFDCGCSLGAHRGDAPSPWRAALLMTSAVVLTVLPIARPGAADLFAALAFLALYLAADALIALAPLRRSLAR